ncbi:amidase [Rhodococcus qingshengii]|uniref:amidase n=1 Tax=Rhodococcus qingshengii TaxID=334542 RepID=UPI002AFDF839|nr:amidase family protein [Rhodococcus qingshengii]MEA1798595.1 amidase family protein [Rhodococcus qingshengii]
MNEDKDETRCQPLVNRRRFLNSAAAITGAVGSAAFIGGFGVPAAQAQAGGYHPEGQSVAELARALDIGAVTSVDLVRAYRARIAAYDQRGPKLNAMITLNDRAETTAMELDAERRSGNVRGPLHGIPIIVKDNFDTADLPTSAGSVLLAQSVPPQDSTIVAQLRSAGAIVLGKSNMSEWAIFISTDSSRKGQTRNPHNPAHNPGGSSGGTGAAIAADFGAVGLGTDTSGSIRIPSAHNSLFGLRPTKGLTSIGGIVPLAVSQDTAGPIGRTVSDLAIVLDVIAGHNDPRDPSTSAGVGKRPVTYQGALSDGALRGARIGVARSMFKGVSTPHGDVGVLEVMESVLHRLQASGAVLIDVPELDETEALAADVVLYESCEDIDGYLKGLPIRPVAGIDAVLKSNTSVAYAQTRLLAARATMGRRNILYSTAIAQRKKLADRITGLMNRYDVAAILHPTVQVQPPKIPHERVDAAITADIAPCAGLPALSVPGGMSPDGLPVGFDLLGRAYDESTLLNLAYSFERHHNPRVAPKCTPPL